MNPPAFRLEGPDPVLEKPLDPEQLSGHDAIWWLDRMVRGNQPLVERMTLIWHDWFATRGIGPARRTLMLRQNWTFRRHALGSFRNLALQITQDPAMLLFLSGVHNRRGRPNENYARELMELFTLGAGRGYTERDVREQARALTGFTYQFRPGVGHMRFHYDARRHDAGVKRIFGRRGQFDYRRVVDLCLGHRAHPRFFVEKLWSYFVPTPPDERTRAGLIALYRGRRFNVKPVLEAILKHPGLYGGPRMVKPPAVYLAGLARGFGLGLGDRRWNEVGWGDVAGQRLLAPPSVAGWDDSRWLDTATFTGRWEVAYMLLNPRRLDYTPSGGWGREETAESAVAAAVAAAGNPTVTPESLRVLLDCAEAYGRASDSRGPDSRPGYYINRQSDLRLLIATAPDMHSA